MTYLLRGLLIGLVFGIPVGAVGAMTVQRTYAGGLGAGLLTGLGSSVADCLYAMIGAFGLTVISDFLLKWQHLIRLAGSGLILLLGGMMLLRKPRETQHTSPHDARGIRLFRSSFSVGMLNPAAMLTFLLAFSTFGLYGLSGAEGVLLVGGIFTGTFLWWCALAGLVSLLKRKSGARVLPVLSRVCGIALLAFGLVMLFQKG